MDRLSFVIVELSLLSFTLAGCNADKGAPAPPPPGRVVAVAAKSAPEETAASFCDVLDGTGTVHLPPLAGGAAPNPGGGYLWVNLWATWCKPCIEEMPMLAKWAETLRSSGKKISLVFVSVDESPETLQRFYASRPGFPASDRLSDPETLPAFLTGIGLGENTGLPIHLFVAPNGKAACVRAAAVSENHFDVISRLVE